MSELDELPSMGDQNEEDGNNSGDEIEVTAKKVNEMLTTETFQSKGVDIQAWLNEKFAPDLLETRIELVECMLEQVKQLEAEFTNKDNCLTTSLQKVEKKMVECHKCNEPEEKGTTLDCDIKLQLERVKFVIASYLRERLKKIENNVMHILEQETKGAAKLSREEMKFAQDYAESLETHMNTLVLQHVPSNMQSIDKKKIPRPNLDEYVFLKVNEGQDQFLLDPEDDPLDMTEKSQFIARYRPVAATVESGAFSLI